MMILDKELPTKEQQAVHEKGACINVKHGVCLAESLPQPFNLMEE